MTRLRNALVLLEIAAGWLFVARPGKKGSLFQSAILTAVVAIVGLTIDSDRLHAPRHPPTYDLHAFTSVDLAANWVFCGKYSMRSARYDLAHYLLAHNDDTREIQLPAVMERAAGSREKYCSEVALPFRNNENSLFYLISALFAFRPGLSVAGLGVALTWVRVAGLVFIVFALIEIGASLLFALLTLKLGLEISSLSASMFTYSLYPFLLTAVGVYAGLLALTVHLGLHRSSMSLGLAATALGVFGGLFYNLRTSYLPIVALGYLMFLGLICFERGDGAASPMRKRLKTAGVASAGFAAGLALFHLLFTYPLIHSAATSNYTYHPVAHPLVLSLALPPNALSDREGIRWQDNVGLDLARKVDSNVDFLGPGYDRALLTYYLDLWRRYPGEMRDIYLAKWRLSTTQTMQWVNANMGRLAPRLLRPIRGLDSGIGFTLLFLAATVAALLLGWRYGPGAGIFVATLAGAGFLISIESAIIMPFFYLQYHNAQLFALLVIDLVFFQTLVNIAWWVLAGAALGSRS